MVDINPASWTQQFTPRSPDLVDAVAEVRRIAEQQMRSNPLANGIVPYGLTRWRGNYGGDLVWFGEFQPNDLNLDKPQRGISFVRDDTQRNSALSLYDPTPEEGVPLRQRLALGDADGRTLLAEGQHDGGRAFPRYPVVVYPATVVSTNAADNVAAWGRSSVVGRYLDFVYLVDTFNLWPMQGAPGFGNANIPLETAAPEGDLRVTTRVRVQAGDYTLLSDSQVGGSGSFFVAGTLDLGGGSSTPWAQRIDYMTVDVLGWITAGTVARNAFRIQPLYFHSYSDW